MVEVTAKEFNEYEKVRKSGATNMMNVFKVVELTGLAGEKVYEIMSNYLFYELKFSGDNK